MPRYRHPLAGDGPGHPPSAVHVSREENAAVDDAGEFEAPTGVGAAVARQHGLTESDIRVDDNEDTDEGGTCEVVKGDGEVCGRDLPCPYHSEGDD